LFYFTFNSSWFLFIVECFAHKFTHGLDTKIGKFGKVVPLIECRGYLLVRDNFFHPDLGPVGNLGEGVEAWRGYHSSIRPTGLGLTLNLGKLHCCVLKPFPHLPLQHNMSLNRMDLRTSHDFRIMHRTE